MLFCAARREFYWRVYVFSGDGGGSGKKKKMMGSGCDKTKMKRITRVFGSSNFIDRGI